MVWGSGLDELMQKSKKILYSREESSFLCKFEGSTKNLEKRDFLGGFGCVFYPSVKGLNWLVEVEATTDLKATREFTLAGETLMSFSNILTAEVKLKSTCIYYTSMQLDMHAWGAKSNTEYYVQNGCSAWPGISTTIYTVCPKMEGNWLSNFIWSFILVSGGIHWDDNGSFAQDYYYQK